MKSSILHPSSPLPSRVVWLTGATGGLGAGLVREFTAQGWHVAAGFHSSKPPLETGQIWPVQWDVTNGLQTATVVTKLLERWHRVDALINNAGLTADHPVWQLSDENWDRVLQVNLKGVFNCCRAVLGPMRQQKRGHIINVASLSGRSGQRGQANYAAAKAGLLGFTEALAKEVGPQDLCVNAVLPGVLPTRMTAHLNQERLAELAAANALGRINSIQEVARFIVFLASLKNVSGQVFQLDSRIGPWT